MKKYFDECPCCGGQKEREPTLTETTHDVINAAVREVLGHCWDSADNWPGTNAVAKRVVAAMTDAGLRITKPSK